MGNDSNGRRDFLKRAGTIGWAVPTITALNLPAAFAGDPIQTSVTPTTMAPTTTMAPGCRCTATLVEAIDLGGNYRFVIDITVSGCPPVDNAALNIPGFGSTSLSTFQNRMEFFTNTQIPVPVQAEVILVGGGQELARCGVFLPMPTAV